MSTISNFKREEIVKENQIFSSTRTTIETAFFANNVIKVSTISQAYDLAKNSPGTIVTDMPIYEAENQGLDKDSKVLLFNDGATVARFAGARIVIGEANVEEEVYASIAREAVFQSRKKKLYHAEAFVGLHEDFMLRAHLLIPEGYENTLYNWMLNFQYITEEYMDMYRNSKKMPEGDIYIFSDPDYYPASHPDGLALFNPDHNCSMLLGMRYFGEHKKGTLTLAWALANRNNYIACHGGMKRYNLDNGEKYRIGVFGLSGSGKSTLTHAKHNGKYDITILHDDAYIISTEDGSCIALEPTYFDKTQDYPTDHPDNKYLLSVQNCGVTLDSKANKVIVTSDIRNPNGRSIKSGFWSPNRVNKINKSVDSIAWIMKESVMPPIMKINNPILASVMGATLATKRSSAEKLDRGRSMDELVIEPYANPFRTYPLSEDYRKFKELFDNNVDCYIINTGYFLDRKIPKELTLDLLEEVVTKKARFKKLGNFSEIEYLEIQGFTPSNNEEYRDMWKNSIEFRKGFFYDMKSFKGGKDRLPDEVIKELIKLEEELTY